MSEKQGRCTNFGNCARADNRETTSVPTGEDFLCPECSSPLTGIAGRDGSRKKKLLLLIPLFLLACVVGGIYFLPSHTTPPPVNGGNVEPPKTTSPEPNKPEPTKLESTVPESIVPESAKSEPPKPEIAAKTILNFRGSTTLGYGLIPELAKAFLETELKASPVEIREPHPGEFYVQGVPQGQTSPVVIEILAKGSGQAFTGLQSGEADIGMASRRIKPAESARLKSLGDMTGKACEHVVALDGIAIVVHPSNPMVSFSVEQVRKIFLGEVPDWSQLGIGPTGQIRLYVRDKLSGTHDSFKDLVMKGKDTSKNVDEVESAEDMTERVSQDVKGIGYNGLPYVKGCKSLRIAEKGTTPLAATKLTVRSEDYPLSRRLYLYTSAAPQNRWTKRFVEFALSDAGQDIVEKVGFVGQRVEHFTHKCPEGAPAEYCQKTRHAEKVSFNFRFKSGSSHLDNKANRDVGRLVQRMDQPANRNRRIILIGFADSQGSRDANLVISKNRAKSVKEELASEGLTNTEICGFGQELPVADNSIEEGREKNRRVEIWLESEGK